MDQTKATEGNILRLGWKGIGYRVNAQDMSKVRWFRWWVMLFAFIPAFSFMMYLVHVLGNFPPQQRLWWEILGMIAVLAFFSVCLELATWQFIHKMCKSLKPIDGGMSVTERRRTHAQKLYKKYKYGIALFAALMAIFSYETGNGISAVCAFLFSYLALEIFYFQYIEQRDVGEKSGTKNTK